MNKPPKWSEKSKAFVLNFNGRVDKPSVKNFQLVDEVNGTFPLETNSDGGLGSLKWVPNRKLHLSAVRKSHKGEIPHGLPVANFSSPSHWTLSHEFRLQDRL